MVQVWNISNAKELVSTFSFPSGLFVGLNMPKNMISEKRKLAKIDAFI